MKFRTLAKTVVCAAVLAAPSIAAAWDLSAEDSVVSFGSIKNDAVGEAHTFSGLSGSVSNDGAVNISIDLTSVNTNIDIRNERMGEHVFQGATTAEITALVDVDDIRKMRPGQSMNMEIDAVLNLLGNEVDVFIDAFVLRVSPTRVMVSTNTASFLTTEDLGIDAGINVLQDLAKLNSITRVTPVTLRLMFDR